VDGAAELAHGAARADAAERKAKRQQFIQELLTALPIHPVTVSVALRVGQIDGENQAFRGQVRDMGIQELLCTPRSPWQWAYVERVIGSIRRECLDHVIVFDESSLRRILRYLDYYHRARTHLSLGKDSPEPRSIQPPGMAVSRGRVPGRWTTPPLRTTDRLRPALLNIGADDAG
jgi:transposase InsO family protein